MSRIGRGVAKETQGRVSNIAIFVGDNNEGSDV